MDDWFRVELSYTSNAIEGNTLNRKQAALVLEKGITIGGKLPIEHLAASNHAQALDWIKERVNHNPNYPIQNDILDIHAIVIKGIDDIHAGHYRSVPIQIFSPTVVLPNPMKVVDGNGRCARLLMNMMLLMSGYPPAIIRKRDRLTYIQSLEKAQLGNLKYDYFTIIAKAVDRSLNIYLSAATGENPTPDKEYRLLKIGVLTKQGLLNVSEITDSGYQLYSSEMVERIGQI
ncbi:MAG: Fic family protein [Gammaproteobacteria bacterium]|nr:Fic family protein [Gammaproteobacteria bacterium]MCY4219690.1 Fic family protein [Gammaproteobacteria bacterium]